MKEIKLKDLEGLTIKNGINKITTLLDKAYKIFNNLGIDINDYYFELADGEAGNIENETIDWKNLHIKDIWCGKDYNDDDNNFWWNFKIETKEDLEKIYEEV